MAGPKRETEEEMAFRKAQEEVKSVLDGTQSVPLPEGTDYYVRATHTQRPRTAHQDNIPICRL